jgi:aryl-alcohol dehydrogenase-like predicted oxidoreductase
MKQKQVARRRLGECGPDVSRLCLSAGTFGSGTGEREADAMIARFGEAGGNFLNTAGPGADGTAERIVGRAIRHDRDRWIIAATAATPADPTSIAAGPGHWLRDCVDRRRDSLGTDSIDLLYLRLDDGPARLEEAIETLGELIESGAIGAWGFCNFRAWRIAELVRIADCLDVPRPAAAQSYYHALYRLMEMDYLPACAHFGIGVVAYAPLARGMLSEEFFRGGPLLPGAGPQDPMLPDTAFRPAAMEAVRAIARHLQPTGRAVTGFALQWVLANKLISSVLIRPQSLDQLDRHLGAVDTSYTPNDEAFMNGLVPSGHFAGTACLNLDTEPAGRVLG